jgi:surface protein
MSTKIGMGNTVYSERIVEPGPPPESLYGDAFVFTVETTSPAETFTINCQNLGTFNANIVWGDGTPDSTVVLYNESTLSHIYPNTGTHEIWITGTFSNIYMNNIAPFDNMVREIKNFGDVAWLSLISAFNGCKYMTSVSTESSDLSNVTSMKSMFDSAGNFTTKATTFDFTNFDSGLVTSMEQMFYNSYASNIDVSQLNISSVETVSGMFFSSDLTSLDISNWDTSSITDFSGFLHFSTNLATVNVSGINTSSAIDMGSMFAEIPVTTLDLSSFDTFNVIDFSYMFAISNSLSTLDLSGFDTSNATNIDYMIYDLDGVSIIGPEHFDVTSVTQAGNFCKWTTLPTQQYTELLVNWGAQAVQSGVTIDFNYCYYFSAAVAARAVLDPGTSWSITDLGLLANNDFVLSIQTTGTDEVFQLTTYDVANTPPYELLVYNATVDWGDTNINTITAWNDANRNHTYATPGTYTITVSGTFPCIAFWVGGGPNAAKVRTVTNLGDVGWVDINGGFEDCIGLTSFVAGDANLSLCRNMRAVFDGCTALTTCDLSNVNSSVNISIEEMFLNCTSLTTINVTNFDTSAVIYPNYIFTSCTSLTTIYATTWDTSNMREMEGMFWGCSALTSIDISNWSTLGFDFAGDLAYMFENCTALTSIDVTGLLNVKVEYIHNMFNGVPNVTITGIEDWDVTGLIWASDFLPNTVMPTSQYDQMLINWNAQAVQSGVQLDMNSTYYSTTGETARTNLISSDSWVINDLAPIAIWPSANDYSYDSKVLASAIQGSTAFMSFNPTGTKIVCMRSRPTNDNQAAEFDVSTPWDISTTSFASRVLNPNWNVQDISGGDWSNDGNIWFALVDNGLTHEIHRFVAAAPYSPVGGATGTSVNINSILLTTGSSVNEMYAKNDGTAIYLSTRDATNSVPVILELTMSTPWDITTLATGDVRQIFSGTCNSGMVFSPDGLRLYKITDHILHSHQLTTAWDITTIPSTTDGAFNMAAQIGVANTMHFRADGAIYYVYNFADSKIYQYSHP